MVSSILAILAALLDIIRKIPDWITFWNKAKVDRTADRRVDDIDRATKEAQDAKTIKDKADAACKIEKALNPDSTCDVDAGKH